MTRVEEKIIQCNVNKNKLTKKERIKISEFSKIVEEGEPLNLQQVKTLNRISSKAIGEV